MELTQVRTEEPLLQNVPQRSRTSCCHWVSICSFVLLLGATVILALLHFKIITTGEKDEIPMPEVLQIKNYLESVPNTQAMNGKRAAAHLMGKKGKGRINWQGVSTNAFKDGSIKLVNNALEIEEDGLYFVYSQVVYTGKDCKKIQELTHSILRRNDSDPPMYILRSSKTVCEVNSDSSWTQPIYQGGLFKLDEGDVLYTETSHVDFLDTNSAQVYFGILAV
ncbi:tumor necrosis factor-like [Dendropsophus ebraccatus]|uniref:tumor necrosis factor-like n=1 Tax=Dendropsophus ebraccatus TaxID=150705 RepID=UPI003831612A